MRGRSSGRQAWVWGEQGSWGLRNQSPVGGQSGGRETSGMGSQVWGKPAVEGGHPGVVGTQGVGWGEERVG